jgi:phosphate transport system substrate-binding protein
VIRTRSATLAAVTITSAMALAACGGGASNDSGLTGSVRIDGSSTVYPLTALAAEDFMFENSGVQVTVAASGTGGGFDKFCRGETDGNDASRSIKQVEIDACADTGIEYAELQIAVDALTVVVNKDNDWATCLTVEELSTIWAPDSQVNNWNQVRPEFPDVPLPLFGAGTDSGTFDYFTDAINGEEGASRTDYTPTEDDNVTVQGVSGSRGGLGYFGFSYFEENADKLVAVEIDNGDGCVAPSVETAQDGTYAPLSRPLFVYASKQALAKPQVKAFFDYYVANDASIAEGALFIPLNAEQQAELASTYAELTGSGPATEE